MWLGIDKNGVERVVTVQTDSTYKIAASQLGVGNYSAYFTVYNGSGSIDTERVEFTIADYLKNPVISIKNDELGLNDSLEVTVSAEGEVDYHTIQIWNEQKPESKSNMKMAKLQKLIIKL